MATTSHKFNRTDVLFLHNGAKGYIQKKLNNSERTETQKPSIKSISKLIALVDIEKHMLKKQK